MDVSSMDLVSVYSVVVLENGVPIAHYALSRYSVDGLECAFGGIEPRDHHLLQEVLTACMASENFMNEKQTLRDLIRDGMRKMHDSVEDEVEDIPYPIDDDDLDDIPF